jgi:opacity protein-like surface antigen
MWSSALQPVLAAGPAAAWDGCYVGAQAGVGRALANWTYTNANPYSATGNNAPQLVDGARFTNDRGVIGLQAGCNRAISDDWIAGVEASWLAGAMRKEVPNSGFIPFPQDPNFNYRQVLTTTIQSIGSLTGRIGYAPSTDWLLYAKAGAAFARIETAGRVTPAFDPPVFDFSTRAWHPGWTVGAGVEYRLFRNVTVGAEYNYYGFGKALHSGVTSATDTVNGVNVPASPVQHRVGADVQTVMARVNFNLGSGPEPARDGPYAAYAAALKAPPFDPGGQFSAFSLSEVKYSSWSGTRGANVFAPNPGSGYQVYSPTTIGIDYVAPSAYKLETRVKSGYVFSSQNTLGQIARYEGPVDTQASFNLTLLSFESIRPLLGLALNLPTGNSYLPGNQRFTRMDPDLVDVGSYGAGFNVNPTAGFIVGLNETTAISLSAGYTWQGAFTKEGVSLGLTPANTIVSIFDLANRINPGDTYTVNGNITTRIDSLTLLGSFAYMGESNTSINGVLTGRSGAKFTSNATAKVQLDERWLLSLNVSWNYSEKNVIPGFSGLVVEPKNSNSHVVIASFDPSYALTERWRLAANYSFLWRDRNFYDPIEQQFVPAKQKHTVGATATYAWSETASLFVRGSHAWVRQDDGPLLVTTITPPPPAFALQPPSLRYDVWQASVGANLRF